MAVRKLLRPIFKVVHPDLTPSLPEEAKTINQKALMKLNAYVDILESSKETPAPFVRETLTFFRPFLSRKGVQLEKASSFNLTLASIPPMVNQDYKDYVAAELIREVEYALEAPCGIISDSPDVDIPKLFEKDSTKDKFNKIWWEETHDSMFKQALYEDVEETRRRVSMKVFQERYEVQLRRKANKMKNKTHRKKQLAMVEARAQRRVDEKFQRPVPAPITIADDQNEAKAAIIENGLHPDLVFFHDLTQEQKMEGVKRLCGMELKEAHIWLMRNLWKVLREDHEIALVLSPAPSYEWRKGPSGSFAVIPYNFDLLELVDLVEDNL